MTQTCGRCHSYARVALQTPHARGLHPGELSSGQFPTLEYQALARDRDWWGSCRPRVIPFLPRPIPWRDAGPFAGDASANMCWWAPAGVGDYTRSIGADPQRRRIRRSRWCWTLPTAAAALPAPAASLGRASGARRCRTAPPRSAGRQHRRRGAPVGPLVSGRQRRDRRPDRGRPRGRCAAGAGRLPRRLKLGEETRVTLAGTGLAGDLTLPEGVTGSAKRGTASPSCADRQRRPGPVGDRPWRQSLDLVAMRNPTASASSPTWRWRGSAAMTAPSPRPRPVRGDGLAEPLTASPPPATTSRSVFRPMAHRQLQRRGGEDAGREIRRQHQRKRAVHPAEAGPNPERPMMTNNAGNLKVIATVDRRRR